MELNFAFLRVGAVRWYCPRAKGEKRQKQIELDVQSVFVSPQFRFAQQRLASRLGRCFCTSVQRSPPETRTPLLHKRGAKYIFFWRGSAHFIDSLSRLDISQDGFFSFERRNLPYQLIHMQQALCRQGFPYAYQLH